MSKRDNGDALQGKSKRHKSKYYAGSKKSFSNAGVPVKMEGFLVTCNQGCEFKCSVEIIRLLERFLEEGLLKTEPKQNTEKAEEEKKSSITDIDKLLATEVDDIRSNKKGQFTYIDTGCNGTVFIRQNRTDKSSPGPTELADAIVRSIYVSKKAMTRYTNRLLPAEVTCHASAASVSEAIVPLLEKHFPADAAIKSRYAVVLEARAHSGLDKMEIIKAVAGLVPAGHTVDLTNPEKTIILQVVKSGCTVGVVSDFKMLLKYNLYQLATSDQGKRQKQAANGGNDKGLSNSDADNEHGGDEEEIGKEATNGES